MALLLKLRSVTFTIVPANNGESTSHRIVGAPDQKAFRIPP